MAYINVTGIVLRYVNYKDNDRILSIFTPDMGRVDAKARGCRRPKSPLLACTQPFVYGEFELYEGKGRYSVNQCDVREFFYPLREDTEKLSAAYTLLMLLQASVQEGEANASLFSTLYYALSFLSYGENHPLDILLCFLIKFLHENGVRPTITTCALCGEDIRGQREVTFSKIHGGALCGSCALGGAYAKVGSLSMEALRRMLLLEDKDMEKVKLPLVVRRELLHLLREYVEYALDRRFPSLGELKYGE